jgi:hypothetical protein
MRDERLLAEVVPPQSGDPASDALAYATRELRQIVSTLMDAERHKSDNERAIRLEEIKADADVRKEEIKSDQVLRLGEQQNDRHRLVAAASIGVVGFGLIWWLVATDKAQHTATVIAVLWAIWEAIKAKGSQAKPAKAALPPARDGDDAE